MKYDWLYDPIRDDKWRETKRINKRTRLRRCLIVRWAGPKYKDERDGFVRDLVTLMAHQYQGHQIEVRDPKVLMAVSFKYAQNALGFKKYAMLTIKRIKIEEGWAKV